MITKLEAQQRRRQVYAECMNGKSCLTQWLKQEKTQIKRGRSQPVRFATVQTDELAGRCCAGQGGGRNPRAKPERDPRPERTLSAEPDPEHGHSESSARRIESVGFLTNVSLNTVT